VKRVAIATSIIALTVYLITMNRTIGFIDKGELLAAASTLGIPHPTGYPTTMLLGYLFTLILPLREVLALNVMSALLTAASIGALTVLINDLLQRVTPIERRKGRHAPLNRGKAKAKAKGIVGEVDVIDPPTRALLAGAGALGIAFTGIWWGQGNGFEVYSLHALLLPFIVLTFLRFVDEGTQGVTGGMTRRGFVFALMVGLSCTNHLTTVLLAPGLLVYYALMTPRGGAKRWWGRLVGLAPGFAVGLLPYVWLPIRASMQPWFNWGNPSTVETLIDHIRGKQYAVWFGQWQVFGQQTTYFFGSLPTQVGIVGLALALLGMILLFTRNARLAGMLLLFVVACVIWSGSYDIQEIAPYYMTAILGIGLMATVGLLWVYRRYRRQAALGAGALLAVLTCGFNFSSSDESGNRYVEEMTRNVLGGLPKHAVIYSSMWDFWVAGSFYLQKVENVRPDIIVIDQELVRRSWYIDQLERNYPDFMAPVRAETERFRAELYKFEHDLPYDGAQIDAAYYGLLNAMITRHIARRPAYVTVEVPGQIGAGFYRTPHGLAYRLVGDSTTYMPQEFPEYTFTPWKGHVDYYTAKTHQLYAATIFDRARYERSHGNDSLAQRYADYALTFDPGYDVANVPSLPLGGEEEVLNTMRFFDQVRALRAGGTR